MCKITKYEDVLIFTILIFYYFKLMTFLRHNTYLVIH